MKRFLSLFLLVFALVSTSLGQNLSSNSSKNSGTVVKPSAVVKLTLPVKDGSLRFAVIGDTGSGSGGQRDVANMMLSYRQAFPFDFVLMMGDNMYGSETPNDFEKKFSDVYKPLLDLKVKFYAVLGNHDLPLQTHYEISTWTERSTIVSRKAILRSMR